MSEEDEGWSTYDGDRDWIATFEGGKVHPLDLRPEEITLSDLARGLSMQNRFFGRTIWPYSVAQHSVLCARQMSGQRDQLAMLFHDAEEAYPPGDIPRPSKRHPAYKALVEIQERNRRMIFERFGIPALSDDYKSVDCRMLATERRDVYLCPNPHWSSDYEPFGIKIVQWSQEEAMRTWLGTAIALLAGKEYPWCLQ